MTLVVNPATENNQTQFVETVRALNVLTTQILNDQAKLLLHRDPGEAERLLNACQVIQGALLEITG